MRTDPEELLGRHSKVARVVWHPGTTPPYSSLWITVLRFLMLNQPTRYAFAQDFLVHANGRSKVWLDSDGANNASCPIRLSRFARVLREPIETFRYAHVSQFPDAARALLGDFAACPDCLREGFHSLLFSVKGLNQCPLHGLKLSNRICCATLSDAIVFSDKARTHGQCVCGMPYLDYPAARSPPKNPKRDAALNEIADWLQRVGEGQERAAPDPKGPKEQCPQQYARLKIALDVPGSTPGWVVTADRSPLDASTLVIMTYGAAKVSANGPQDNTAKWLSGRQSSPYAYQQTLFCDFKAISRYLRHHTLGAERYWIARFARARDIGVVKEMLAAGGAQAHRAWSVLIWWQSCIWDRSLKNWFSPRPLRLVGGPDIPVLVDQHKHKTFVLPESTSAQEWVARWVNAIGLLAQWQRTLDLAESDSSPSIAMIGKGLTGAGRSPEWSLGLSGEGRWVLCVNRSCGPRWTATKRLGKSERNALHEARTQDRLARVRALCGQFCIWYHADTREWGSGSGPIPVKPDDCKKQRMLPADRKLWFVVVRWTAAQVPSRTFVGRCLSLPVAATGSTTAEAVRHLKMAVERYAALLRSA